MDELAAYRRMIEAASRDLERAVSGYDAKDFNKRPAAGANPANFIYFHVLRHWDRDINLHCRSQSADADAWHRGAFSQRTGYEPIGVGYNGIGTGYGYSQEEVNDVPGDRDALMAYQAMLYQETIEYLNAIAANELDTPRIVDGGRTITIGGRLRHLIAHTYLHAGDIEYVKSFVGGTASDIPSVD